MFNAFRDESAFTLLEAALVIAIIGVLSVVTFGLSAYSAEIYRIASAEEKLYGELLPGLERMVREFQNQSNLNTANGETLDFVNDGKASCEKCEDKSTSIIYSWEDGTGGAGKLYRTGDLSGKRLIADNITYFNVSWDTAEKKLTIDITGTLDDSSISLTTSVHPYTNLQEVAR